MDLEKIKKAKELLDSESTPVDDRMVLMDIEQFEFFVKDIKERFSYSDEWEKEFRAKVMNDSIDCEGVDEEFMRVLLTDTIGKKNMSLLLSE